MELKRTAQDRLVETLFALEDNHVFGLTNKRLAEITGVSEANACRDIAVLERHGLASKTKDGNWRLTPRFGQFANSIMKSFQTAKLNLAKEEAEYLAAMQ